MMPRATIHETVTPAAVTHSAEALTIVPTIGEIMSETIMAADMIVADTITIATKVITAMAISMTIGGISGIATMIIGAGNTQKRDIRGMVGTRTITARSADIVA